MSCFRCTYSTKNMAAFVAVIAVATGKALAMKHLVKGLRQLTYWFRRTVIKNGFANSNRKHTKGPLTCKSFRYPRVFVKRLFLCWQLTAFHEPVDCFDGPGELIPDFLLPRKFEIFARARLYCIVSFSNNGGTQFLRYYQ